MKEVYKVAEAELALTLAQRELRYAALALVSSQWVAECERGARWDEVGSRLLGVDVTEYRDEHPQELNNVLCRMEVDILMAAARRPHVPAVIEATASTLKRSPTRGWPGTTQ